MFQKLARTALRASQSAGTARNVCRTRSFSSTAIIQQQKTGWGNSTARAAAPAPQAAAASKSPATATASVSEAPPHPFAPSMHSPNLDGNDLSYSLNDNVDPNNSNSHDWSRSFSGLSTAPFDKDAQKILLEPLDPKDIEVKPDGIVYLPEIKYRRILNQAFGPGAWGLAPRGETTVTPKLVTREYGLVVHGRLVSIARGEQQYFDIEGIPTATEGCKSNALMRCCKDIGIASELWDPVFLRSFIPAFTQEVWVEHVVTKKRRKIWLKKGTQVAYPYKATTMGTSR